MKHVWILNHYAQEPSGAGGTRHFHLAQKLKKVGWNVTIIASSVDHQSGNQRLKPQEKIKLTIIDGVEYLWLRTSSYEGNGVGRIVSMLSYTLKSLLPKNTQLLTKPDVIIGSSVHPLAGWAAARLARRHNVPFVFEVRDLWPQTLVDMGRLTEKSLVTSGLRKLEVWLYKNSSKIIVLLPKADKYIIPLGVPADRIVWIPNGVDLELFPRISYEACDGKPFTLMYFGAFGQANGLDNLLRAMKLIQSNGSNIRLRLIGGGVLKADLKLMAAEFGLTNTTFEEPVSKLDIPLLASSADCFVITVLDKKNLYRYGISMNKLFDYLASQRPIIIASDAANNPVDEAQAGFSVPPENPQALAEAIINMSQVPIEERGRLGVNGRKYVERNHSFTRLAERMGSLLDQITSTTSR